MADDWDVQDEEDLARLVKRRGREAVARALEEESPRAVMGYPEDDPAYRYQSPLDGLALDIRYQREH